MTRSWRGGLLAALVLGALVGCGAAAPHATSAGATASRAFSPYTDVTVGGSSLASRAQAAGLRSMTLAFVDGLPGACRATWDGQPLTATVSPSAVGALRAAGVATVVSFGGRDGPELARSCPDANALAAQYQAVLDAYRPARLDFDLEGAAVADSATNARRWSALRTVLARAARSGSAPAVSLTLPVSPSGLSPDTLALVAGALAAGVHVAHVNLLAMDYGPDFPSGRVSMAAYAAQAARAAARQLSRVYRSGSGFSRVGLTVMAGVNDTPGETFTLSDARTVAAFAARHRLAALSMWSLNRDRACPAGSSRAAQPTCSGVAQAPFAFTHQLAG